MLMTVTNTSATLALNVLDTYVSGPSGSTASIVATGGARVRALPHPFSHATIAASGNLQLPVHPEDMRENFYTGPESSPRSKWNQLVNAGMVTLAFADQTGVRDTEERLVGNINDGI